MAEQAENDHGRSLYSTKYITNLWFRDLPRAEDEGHHQWHTTLSRQESKKGGRVSPSLSWGRAVERRRNLNLLQRGAVATVNTTHNRLSPCALDVWSGKRWFADPCCSLLFDRGGRQSEGTRCGTGGGMAGLSLRDTQYVL